MLLIKITTLFSLIFSISVLARPSERIIGGIAASVGQFPYVASLQLDEPDYHGHLCGATILSNQWVITAAQCLWEVEPQNAFIMVGSTLQDSGGVLYNVSKVIPHPDYNITSTTFLWHDVGLIKINGEMEFSDTVQSIGLGPVGTNQSSTLIGWESGYEAVFPYEMEYVNVTALSDEDCMRLGNGSIYNGIYFPRGPGQVCAFDTLGGIGSCYVADFGGPLVANDSLVGIVSYTLDDTCIHDFPDVFTRIWYYNDWITETMANS